MKWRLETDGYLVREVVVDGKRRQIRQHRMVVENHIGHKLSKNQDVHHKNGIKTDNRIENLEIVSRSEHRKLHAKERKLWLFGGRSARPWRGVFETCSLCKKIFLLEKFRHLERNKKNKFGTFCSRKCVLVFNTGKKRRNDNV